MTLTADRAATALKQGEFLALVRSCPSSRDERRQLDPERRILLAQAFAYIGELKDATELIEASPSTHVDAATKSHAATTLCLISWREGNLKAALTHANAAVHFAQESGNPERVAWAYLHRFRLFAEQHPAAHVLGSLHEVRRAVLRAGDGQATAYLHTCVASLEGQLGRLDEGRRHCDIADSLLNVYPNLWVRGISLLNRGCIAWLNSELQKATEYFSQAHAAGQSSGHASLTLVAQANLGHVQLVAGEFPEATQTLSSVINSDRAALAWKIGSADGLARIHLALSELDSCSSVLAWSERQVQEHPELAALYHVRWSAVTRARLAMKRGQPTEAIHILRQTKRQARRLRDRPLEAVSQLVAAQAAADVGDLPTSAQLLMHASEVGIAEFAELQPQFHYCGGIVVETERPRLAQQLRDRATRMWTHTGIVSLQHEINDRAFPEVATSSTLNAGDDFERAECIVNSIAAACDVAEHHPSLMGVEILAAIHRLGCSPDARLLETSIAQHPPKQTNGIVLGLGVEQRKRFTLCCPIPSSPAKAILLGDVMRVARAAIALARVKREERTKAAIWPSDEDAKAGGVFLTSEMRGLAATAQRVGPTTVPVLITGETGTGKEVLARVVHAYSNRANATFLPFNCSGVPKDMLDSQLFGHRRGAFTGAVDSFPGVIRAAAGGTLFLDEIGETTLDVQPKLLRFLELSEVHPIGEAHPQKVDVRVIAATNADLDTLIAQGRFREDLFYRLNIVRLHVPPLRERRVEIPALARHYLQKHAQEYRKGDLRLAEETMEYLVLYRWPGNVRQLANEMRRTAALAETGAVLMPEHLSPEIAASRRTLPASERALDPIELVVRVDQPVAAAMQHLERVMIQYALNKCGGRMEETAAMLGLSRKGLYLKRLRYGLETPGASNAEVA